MRIFATKLMLKMRRIFLLFIFSLLSLQLKAQLDTEHWFAPMFDRFTAGYRYSQPDQNIILSTNETEPFDVEIYSGNVLLTTITGLRKGSPKRYMVQRETIISIETDDLMKPVKKGLYLKGPKKFYANLRFSTYNHAEVLTSKGLAGIGNKFHAVVTPMSPGGGSLPLMNFTVGVLATEDNTKVKISGYSPDVVFTNIFSPATTLDFTLNKGEAYIIDGAGYNVGNRVGFIGAKIESDKPISVTNGNFNGQYTNNAHTAGTDIIMDQSVPVDRLGDEFAIVKGNGTIGTDMEGAIIVATEDNTQVYVNGATTPEVVLNEGQYYVLPDTKFVNRGNNHYNLHVKASKNVYLYQLLAGDSQPGSETATGGFNYIPPLNCFLPKEVGEVGEIDTMIGNANGGSYSTVPTKLNIVTRKGATVRVEGYNLTPENGPFDLDGSSMWVTYSIPNVRGNINITSTQAVTAGISAGSGAVGYGGYFSGFSSVPVVKKTGDCAPNVVLEIEGDYDSYQWKRNGVNIPGATKKTYTPTTAGNYSVQVSNADCSQTTAEVGVKACSVDTVIDDNLCGKKVYTPAFTKSKQRVNIHSVKIIAHPAKGTVTINSATGQITYEPAAGALGGDSFSYQFCGNDEQPDCEQVTVNVSLNGLTLKDAVLKNCSGVFDLTQADVGKGNEDTLEYYENRQDAIAGINKINNITRYVSTGGVIYVKGISASGCSGIAEIRLEVHPSPKVDISKYNASHCDYDFDGKVEVDFSRITAVITDAGNSVKYYLTREGAERGGADNLSNIWTYSQDTEVYVRVASADGCVVIDKISFKIGDRLNLSHLQRGVEVCDPNLDGMEDVDLRNYHSLFTNQAVSVSYHNTLVDAQRAVNGVSFQRRITNGQTFYLRFESSSACPNVATLNFQVKGPSRSTSLRDVEVCADSTTELDPGDGFTAYRWSTGATTRKVVVGKGDYWVDLTSPNGCIYRQNVKVSSIEVPTIERVEIKDNVLTVVVKGGTEPYLYSLDGGPWQTSNVFTDVSKGKHVVYVKSQKGDCEAVSEAFVNIRLVNVVTPNGDGLNDVIDYSELKLKNHPKFQVYDRYGGLVFEGNETNEFIWNGKANGRALSTGSYWYLIEWQEPNTDIWVKKSSWILLKNRE